MRRTSLRRVNSPEAGFGTATALVDLIVLSFLLLVSSSLLRSAASVVERHEACLRAELETRQELVDP